MTNIYCETCHNMSHGSHNCPARLWIRTGGGKQIESETRQALQPGEWLNLVSPVGGTLQVEMTADTYSVTIEDTVLFSAERYGGAWHVTWPLHLRTSSIEND